MRYTNLVDTVPVQNVNVKRITKQSFVVFLFFFSIRSRNRRIIDGTTKTEKKLNDKNKLFAKNKKEKKTKNK